MALAAILVLAAGLRFHGFHSRGLLLFDEGHLVAEARSTGSLWAAAPGALAGKPGAPGAFAALARDCPVIFGKPVHNTLLASLLPAFSDGASATLVLSATAGTLVVWLCFLLARAFFGDMTGLLASLLLAVSPYHLMYSREGLSDSLAVLFWLGALALWLRAGRGAAALSGVVAGLCAGANYRDFVLIPLVFLLALRDSAGFRAGLVRFLSWLAGLLAALAVFQVPWIAWSWLAGREGASFPNGTYLGQLRTLLGFHGSQGFLFRGWPAFGWYTLRWEGIVSLLWLLAVLPFQFIRWKGADGFLNISLLVPWLVFSAYWDNASRFFSVLLPFIAIVKSRWLLAGLSGLSVRWGLTAAGIAGIAAVALCLPRTADMASRPTPYAGAAHLLSSAPGQVHLSTNPRAGEAMLGPGLAAPFPPARFRSLKLRGKPARYAVTDLQVMFGGYFKPQERYETARWVAGSFRKALEVPYHPGAVVQYIVEQDLDFRSSREWALQIAGMNPSLKVFDLSSPLKASRAAKPPRTGKHRR